MGRNAETIRRVYDAWNRRDWPALEAAFAPAVEWFHAGRDEHVRGRALVVALFRASAEAYPDARIELRALHECGEVVIAEGAFRRKSAALGAGPATFCEIGVVRDGLCVKGSTYADALRVLMDLEAKAA